MNLRYAVRSLLRSPGFAGAAVVTLALGIGANTAIFSAVDAALLRPLPFRDPDRLVQLWETHPSFGRVQVAYPDYMDWRDGAQSFEGIAAYTYQGIGRIQIMAAGEPEEVQGSLVSENLLPVMGVQPAIGRNFLAGETQAVLLSDALWRRKFGGDATLIGRDIRLNGGSFRVIGIMPQRSFPQWADVLAPISLLSEYDRTARKHHLLEVVGRLKPGVRTEPAQDEVQAISTRLARDYPATNNTVSATLVPLARQLAGDSRTPLLVLLAVVGLVLLIATANVANLLLARAAGRRKEIAIRIALGAGRGHLMRQLLTESLVLAGAGGVMGVLLAAAATPWLRVLAEGRIPRAAEIAVDARVLGFAFAAALAAGILFGLAPALAATRSNQNSALREGSRGSTVAAHRGLRGMLVAGQVALAMLVLVSAGLLTRSLARMIGADPGFRMDHLLTAQLTLPVSKYGTTPQLQNFYGPLMERLAAAPGVEGVATVDSVPLTGNTNRTRFGVEGAPTPDPGRYPVAQTRSVSPNYFSLMRIPVLAGRTFSGNDLFQATAIVNETLARRFFAGQNAVGHRLLLGVVDTQPTAIPIVGVVADTHDLGLGSLPEPEMYFAAFSNNSGLVVRTQSDPLGMANALRHEVSALDPEQPLTAVITMDHIADRSLAGRRFSVMLIGLFAALALALAAVGLYGVVSYSVEQRTHEMGLRMALGASHGNVLRLVLGEGLKLTLAGLGVGAAAASIATRWLASELYGVTPLDPRTFFMAAATLAAVALLGAYLPAQRAMRVNPLVALRDE